MSRYSATGLKPQACPFCRLPQIKPGTDDAECANGHQWHPLTTERWPASCEACPETTRCADQAPGPGHGRCILRLEEEAKAQGTRVDGGVPELAAWIIAQGEEAAAKSGPQAPRSALELAYYWEQQVEDHGAPYYLDSGDLREIVAALRIVVARADGISDHLTQALIDHDAQRQRADAAESMVKRLLAAMRSWGQEEDGIPCCPCGASNRNPGDVYDEAAQLVGEPTIPRDWEVKP